MANFIVTYDLNGPHPTHSEIDAHLRTLPNNCLVGRLLETVWYVGGATTALDLYHYVARVLSDNDKLLVIHASDGVCNNLLVKSDTLKQAFATCSI